MRSHWNGRCSFNYKLCWLSGHNSHHAVCFRLHQDRLFPQTSLSFWNLPGSSNQSLAPLVRDFCSRKCWKRKIEDLVLLFSLSMLSHFWPINTWCESVPPQIQLLASFSISGGPVFHGLLVSFIHTELTTTCSQASISTAGGEKNFPPPGPHDEVTSSLSLFMFFPLVSFRKLQK